jgi:hypothetical protein
MDVSFIILLAILMLNFSILVMVTVFVFLLPEGEMLLCWRFLVILFVVLCEAI